MTQTGSTGSRGSRYTPKATLKEQLLAAAKRRYQEVGLTVSLEHIRLEVLLREAEVPKTSFYRLWGTKEEFFLSLLEALVVPDGKPGAAFDAETLATAERAIHDHAAHMGDPEGRRRVLAEAIRLGALQNYRAIQSSVSWRTYMAILAALPGIADAASRQRLHAALQAAEGSFIETMAQFYATLLEVFQLELREGATVQQVAAAGAAVVEGLVQRHVVSPQIVDSTVPGPAVDGGTTPWSVVSIAFLGVIEAFLRRE